MSLKNELIINTVFVIAAFACGRYSVPKQPKVEQRVIQLTDETEHVNKDVHSVKVVKRATDGSTTVTVTTDVVDHDTVTRDQQLNAQTIVTPPKTSKLNVSALVSTDFTRGLAPAYGVSVSKEVLGPVTIGAFGFTSGVFGLSIGLDF